ncbi:MAG: hypothetical protein IIY21_14370 [Clostridiales bacterium]|nr:hypothetical protein [Clostridiales bacterium]
MTISQFVNILLECCTNTYHKEAYQEKAEYIVWREVSYRSMYADNIRALEPAIIAVDLFSKHEFSEIPARIKQAFKENEISYKGPEVIYIPEMDVTQYAYTVEVL